MEDDMCEHGDVVFVKSAGSKQLSEELLLLRYHKDKSRCLIICILE